MLRIVAEFQQRGGEEVRSVFTGARRGDFGAGLWECRAGAGVRSIVSELHRLFNRRCRLLGIYQPHAGFQSNSRHLTNSNSHESDSDLCV